jgi:lysophospholipase L1-like esterase
MEEPLPTAISPRRRWLFAAVMFFGLLALMEGGARVALLAMGPDAVPLEARWQGRPADALRDQLYRPDDDCFFRLAPGVSLGRTGNPRIFDVQTNSLGLRGPEVAREKPDGTFRVLCIGDSCTFGSGAAGDQTYPARTEQLLRARRPDRPIEVLNAGVPGFTSYQGMMYLRSEGLSLDPDVVVVALGFNDIQPARPGDKRPFAEGREMSDREYARTVRGAGGLGITRLARRLMRPTADATPPESPPAAPAARPIDDDSDLDSSTARPRVSAAEYREHLEAMVAESRRRGAAVVLVGWPILPQAAGVELAGRSAMIAENQRLAAEVARSGGAAFLDLVPVLAGREELFIDIVHLNPAGYAAVAEALAEAIDERLGE